MIVKNEAPVILRCLESVLKFIDYWVICDTGSSDGTQQIICDYLHGIPGELIQSSWRDFGYNRTEALQFAKGHCDYVLMIDADDVLDVTDAAALHDLVADAYYVIRRSGILSYQKIQLVSNKFDWKYIGVAHEYIHCAYAKTIEFRSGVRILCGTGGARNRDPETYQREISVLETEVAKDPTNARMVFYLAQTYRDAGKLELAATTYGHRVSMGGWSEEVWYAMYQIAVLKLQMKDIAGGIHAALKAFQYKPDRAEPFYRIGCYYNFIKEYQLGHFFMAKAMTIPCPSHGSLFVEQDVYDFLLPIEYAVSCYYVGEHTAAIDTANSLLAGTVLPDGLRQRVIDNRQFSLNVVQHRKED